MCPVGTCRRRWQSDPKVGSETSGGRGQRPPRRLSDRDREAPPNLPTAGAGGRPGGGRGWVPRAAFLAAEGRSKRLRAACTGHPRTHDARRARDSSAPMTRAAGAGTRLPRRKRAHAACTWQPRTHGGPIPRYTDPNTPRHTASRRAAYIPGYTTQPIRRNRRRLPRAAFLASSGHSQRSRRLRSPQKTAHATASVGWVWDPPVSERRPSPYRAQHGPRPLQGRGTCVPTRKEGTKTPCSN